MSRGESDRKLVERFLNRFPEEDYSAYELGQKLTGISASDVSRWRRDEWEWVTKQKRRWMKKALRDPPRELEPSKMETMGENGNEKAADEAE